MTTTIETPRTNYVRRNYPNDYQSLLDNCEQIERELIKASDELAKLRESKRMDDQVMALAAREIKTLAHEMHGRHD